MTIGNTEVNNVLKHVGILGMKWGHRKKSSNSEGGDHSKGRTESDGHTSNKIEKAKPKKISELTDAELRERTNRLLLEKQYKELLASQKAEISAGRKATKEVMLNIGKSAATKYGTAIAEIAIEAALTKAGYGDLVKSLKSVKK